MKRLTLITLLFCAAGFVLPPALAALERQIVLGGNDGWNRIVQTDGVRFGPGKGGNRALVLEDAEYAPQADSTDLLLHFNRTPIRDAGGNYTVRSDYETLISEFARLGTGAGSFDELAGGITLDPGREALFSEAPWGDFTIEFWLYPLRMQNGESLLRWEGRRIIEGDVHLQNFECSFSDRKLHWSFHNFFMRPGGEPADLDLSGRSSLLPERWHHHLLRFDARTGLMEYLVDGVPEAVRYVTDSGGERGSVLLPYPGRSGSAPLHIGPAYSGFLDELRISRRFVEQPRLSRFTSSRGVAETELLDLRQAGSTIYRIDVDYSAPEESELFCFYRTAESYEDFLSSPAEWRRYIPGARLDGPVRARWVQLRFELYPDGDGEQTPAVSRAVLRYEPNPPPGPPAQVQALPRDGAVVLQWTGVENPDLGGYLLYYGPSAGNYRGDGAEQGPSPIDVGKSKEIRLTGLENGTLYYFAVASYDEAGAEHHGSLSAESHARPSRIYGAEE